MTAALTQHFFDGIIVIYNLKFGWLRKFKQIRYRVKEKALKLQDMFGKPSFHEGLKKVFEQVPDKNKDVSNDITKTMTEPSEEKRENVSGYKWKIFRNTDW